LVFALEILRRAEYMLGGRSRWLELGSSAELLDWARTEFWHGNGEKPVFGRKNQWADQENSGIFPRWRVNAREELQNSGIFPRWRVNAREELLNTARESIHCTVYTRGAQCGCVTAGKGGKAGDGGQVCGSTQGVLRSFVWWSLHCQPAAPDQDECAPPRGDLTGGENDTNPPVGRSGTLRTLQGCYKSEETKFNFLAILSTNFSICPAEQSIHIKLPHKL
jgi:hypothetical protein